MSKSNTILENTEIQSSRRKPVEKLEKKQSAQWKES